MRFSVLVLLICAPVARAGGVTQTHADFSGRWVLVGSSGALVDVAHTLTIQLTTVDTDVSGRPMAPYISALSVSREIDGVVRTETLHVGIAGGFVGGVAPPASGAEHPKARNFRTVRWVDDCLVIDYADASQGGSRSHTEQWCMNAARRLVVTIRGTQSGSTPVAAIRVYRRQ